MRVHVCAVHVNLATVRVHDVANFANRWLKDAVRGRIGHHQRGEVSRMLVRFSAQIRKIDVPIFQAGDRDNPEARHVGACWIRAVG